MQQPILSTKEGKVLRKVTTTLAEAYADTGQVIEVVEPRAIPTCGKITLPQWREMLAFFAWNYQQNKHEAQIAGFRHCITGAWLLEPLFQEGRGSMATHELAKDDERQAALIADLMGRGYSDIFFTGHDHQSGSAFQSGTDHDDEMKRKGAGFHVTIGYLDKPVYDLHCRSKVVIIGEFDAEGKMVSKGCSAMLPFDILDLVEIPIPSEHLAAMPADLRTKLAAHYLLARAAPDEPFPEEWKSRVVERVWNVSNYNGYHGRQWINGKLVEPSGSLLPSSEQTPPPKPIGYPLAPVCRALKGLLDGWDKLKNAAAPFIANQFSVTPEVAQRAQQVARAYHLSGPSAMPERFIEAVGERMMEDIVDGIVVIPFVDLERLDLAHDECPWSMPTYMQQLPPDMLAFCFDEMWSQWRHTYEEEVGEADYERQIPSRVDAMTDEEWREYQAEY